MLCGGPARTSATGTPLGRGGSSPPSAASAKAYVNFLGGDEDPDRVREAYGDSVYERLVGVKTTYDPDNVFHHNQNIRPRPTPCGSSVAALSRFYSIGSGTERHQLRSATPGYV